MAIYTITGTIGGGKTYYAVNMLKKLLDKDPNLTIITNIRNLKLPHIRLDQLIERHGLKFFTVPIQQSFLDHYEKVIYVIDEAQQYFHRKFYDKDVFYFFQTSRHYGVDIYLITQDKKSLCTELRDVLIEQEIHCLRRSQSLLGEFRYQIIIAGEVASKETLRPNDEIFALYKSSLKKEALKVKRPLYKYLAIAAVVFTAVPIYIYGFWTVDPSGKKTPSTNTVTYAADTKDISKKFDANTTHKLTYLTPDYCKYNIGYVTDGHRYLYACCDGTIYDQLDIIRGRVRMVDRKHIICPPETRRLPVR